MIFDFKKIKKQLLEEKKGCITLEDLDKVITFYPAENSAFEPTLSYTNFVIKKTPEEQNSCLNDEENAFINLCQKTLRKLGFCSNQYQFSEQFMNKSKHYASQVLNEERRASVSAMNNLVKNIEVLNEQENNPNLTKLHQLGEKILTRKILKYY